jgi:hypothetical protein
MGVIKNVGNWQEVAVRLVSCGYRHMLELREIKGLILRRNRLLWAIWCTLHNRLLRIFFQSQNREFWTNGSWDVAEGSLLDHGLRNGGRRENLERLSRGLSRGTAELEPT